MVAVAVVGITSLLNDFCFVLLLDEGVVEFMFSWNRSGYTIKVGDSVKWNWNLDVEYHFSFEMNIYETEFNHLNIMVTKENGFSQSAAGSSNSIEITFNKTGTYHFATRTNLGSNIITGVVTVTELVSFYSDVEVYVREFKASYEPTSSSGGNFTRQTGECEDIAIPNSSENTKLLYLYSVCRTPSITSVNPKPADRTTVFMISGEKFSSTLESNIVTIGGHPCTTMSSTMQNITCVISSEASVQPRAYIPLLVSVRNIDPGYGNAANEAEAVVVLQPRVLAVSPSEGSLAGGTDIIISGYTFDFDEDNLVIKLGAAQCSIKSIQYSMIECTTYSNHGEIVGMLKFYYNEEELDYICGNSDCAFSYSELSTPTVLQVFPTTINSSGNHIIRLIGQGFPSMYNQYAVTVGNTSCSITYANSTTIMCMVPSLPAGTYSLGLRICNLTSNGSRCFGNGLFESGAGSVTVNSRVIQVSPEEGSVQGGTQMNISGYGFSGEASSISVTIDSTICDVRSAGREEIVCITSTHAPGNASVAVTDGGVSIVSEVMFEFSSTSTPTVTSITPSTGTSGDLVTISGTMFGSSDSSISVEIGDVPCVVQAGVIDTSVMCQLGPNFVGTHPVKLTSTSLGFAEISVMFTYTLVISSISSTSGSMAGQNVLQIQGAGFYPSNTTITICDKKCSPTSTTPTITTIECTVPSASDTFISEASVAELPCSVVVASAGASVTYNESYVYRRSLTPQVNTINDTRGGTAGGTAILIHGSGFTGNATVRIANSKCDVMSQTNTVITCVTNRSGFTVRANVMVEIQGKGFAVSQVKFWYVDLWSSPFTWGGGPLPMEGDFVVIPKGQTLLLDTKTPILSYILIKGGELIFDREKGDNEVELHTEGGLIISGGRLEVGTEANPFLSKTQIVLYGHVLSTEIPVYGAKTLALRSGEIHMHGKRINVTWTRLADTAQKDALEIHLQDTVDWEVGGKIVLASTSFSQRENEEMEIATIKPGPGNEGSILTLTTPLKFEHISVEQIVAGRKLETRGEVGYLTRNIVVRGNKNEEWEKEMMDCPTDFRPGQFQVQTCFSGRLRSSNCPTDFLPGQFQVQTCFSGRFGSEVVGDQFGCQVMIHAAEVNKGDVVGQFEYVETSHAGQAFKLGRYPIHFHLNGNVSGSYVRGCSIHHSFNRAVTMHGIDSLLVEKNVAYDILGHAFFLEDGNEQFNVIQDNLGIFVRSSSSLLNVDITPATFWLVNANNYVRRNAAAGGTHFGFWYRLPEHPTGPSFTRSLCPRKQQVLQFENNTAHSFGWYGLWVFRQYHPSPSGQCNDNGHGTSRYDRFFAWRNDKGVEFTEIGALQLRNSVMLDNKFAGVEVTEVEAEWDEENGALINDTLIVGHSQISEEHFCTESGIKTPKSFYLTVSGVTFANFDRDNCLPITACSFCKHNQGGFETRYKNIIFSNAGDKLTMWKWEHEHIHRDLDGSLTGSATPKLLMPTNHLLDPSRCSNHLESEHAEGIHGSICDGNLVFGRLALFNPRPASLEFASLNVRNTHGNIVLPYVFKRLRGTGPAYMAQLELNQTYVLSWPVGETFTNISYSTLISGFPPSDYIIMKYIYPISLDIIEIAGIRDAANVANLSNPATANTGDYFVEDDGVTLNYIIKGGDFFRNEKINSFKTERCKYVDCIPPPPPTLPPPIPTGRPDDAVMWSNTSIWTNNVLPTSGEIVTIDRGTYVIADVQIPRLDTLIINGGLEMLDDMDRVLEANVIIINGGRLVAGYPSTPFRNSFRIVLHGNAKSPLYQHGPEKIRVDTKAIGVFGELILHAMTNTKSWTLLANTANAGSNQITLMESMDLIVEDKIVITSTSFDAYQTEVFEITAVNGLVMALNATLKFTHLGVDESVGSVSYSIRAEVGRLSRKIVIENANPEQADMEAFGCRVLVGISGAFRGSVQLQGVEFKGCGQIGLSESYDPRFSLALVNIGRQTDAYVRNCSFHDGYNTAIGMFGTDNMMFANNVIHSTVGPSMLVTGSDHTVVNNLACLAQFIGTYRERNEISNSLWTANFIIVRTKNITFTGNHAAGGAKSGIHTDGEDCVDSTSTIGNNVAHSSLHCFHVGYKDGSSTGCSKFANIIAYACHHYGLFIYSPTGVQIFDSTFVNNKAAIFVSVIGPSIRTHKVGKKTVQIERTNIISASLTFDCNQDDIIPDIANHRLSHSPGLRTLTDGHVGIFIPSFLSGPGSFPKFTWPSNHNYPSIAGLTTMKQVSFVNFGNRCASKKDAAIMTNSQSEDANHPVDLEMISFENAAQFSTGNVNDYKLLVHEPAIGRVNPSDCVDMDCDGYKQVLLRDIDGSFSGTNSSCTIISKAEFEWDGDARRGIGDYRIPKTMLSNADGTPMEVMKIYPNKGIVRADTFEGDLQCVINEVWNMYVCTGLDHLMLVLESLDADTEVRRLSPIGMGANGFINLLNGPMDNGWCGGYTCQERISAFFGIVGSTFTYTIGLTSTNPQNFALHLLNSDDDQGIVVRIVYTTSQRLDVFVDDKYVPPKNAELLQDQNLKYSSDLPVTNYYPVMSDPNGANFYDSILKQLHVNIKGSHAYKIITTQVIMLSLTVSVDIEDFFDEQFVVRNLALLLKIPANKIRIVNVVRETPQRRRRREVDGGGNTQTIGIEIGDPPNAVLSTVNSTSLNDTNTTSTTNTTNTASTTSFEDLIDLAEMVAAVVQTGEILNGSNATVVTAEIQEPVAAPIDPTGGVLATPETGGPQPDDADENTPTFYDQQLINENEQANVSSAVQLSIPSTLVVTKTLTDTIVEGLPISQEVAPVFTMLDNNGMTTGNLGINMPWTLTATIVSGPQGGFLANHTVPFVKGHASFKGAVFSHPGTYSLTFAVSLPVSADFSIALDPIVVTSRSLSLEVYQQPQDGNITAVLYPYPVIRLIDETSQHSHLKEHTWRNTTWYVVASLENGKEEWTTELEKGEADFTDIMITDPVEHKIVFRAFTVPPSSDLLPEVVTSQSFKIIRPSIAQFTITYGKADFDSVINSNDAYFIKIFETKITTQYPGVYAFNTTVRNGSIIVSTFITSQSTKRLIEVIKLLLSEGNKTLSLEIGGQTLVPSSIVQGSTYLVYQYNLVLILATTIPAGIILLCSCLLIFVVCLCQRRRRAKKKHNLQVGYTWVELTSHYIRIYVHT